MKPFWLSRSLFFVASLCATGAGALAQSLFDFDNSKAVFQCSLKAGVKVDSDGHLTSDMVTDWFKDHYNNFVFDVAEGSLSIQGDTTYWTIVRLGNGVNDLIAQLPGDDPTFNTMRIAAWDNPIRVSMTDGMELYSGLCDRLQ